MSTSRGSFSEGLDNFLYTVGRGEGNVLYPRGVVAPKIPKNISVQAWLREIFLDGGKRELARLSMEPGLISFVDLKVEKGEIVFACLQAVITNSPERVENLFDDSHVPHQYYRLDYDRQCLGDLFTHPIPHIHTEPHGPPRFSGHLDQTGNLVIDFFDFIYRNHFHDCWRVWAKRVCEQELSARSPSMASFTSIEDAYAGSQYNYLEEHTPELQLIKTLLRAAKDKLFNPRINREVAVQLSPG